LRNLSGAPYSSVSGVLSSTNATVSLTYTNATFGTIPAGGTAANSQYDLRLNVGSSTPPGTLLPLSLAVRDGSGNTQTVTFAIFCIPQLNAGSVNPRLSATGSNVTITATFRDGSYQPNENGIASVGARVQATAGGAIYSFALTNNPATVGEFSSSWTIPAASDWNLSLQVFDTQGHTGTYNSVSGGGFSSVPYSGTAGILCYGDDQSGSYGSYVDSVVQAISNAGWSCFGWKSAYRGKLTAGILAAQSSKFLVYYAPYGTDLYWDSTLRSDVDAFIGGGGKVCLAGQLVAYYMRSYGNPAANTAFMSNRFGAAWVKQFNSGSGGTFTNIIGLAGDPVGSGMQFPLHEYSYYRDEIRAVSNGVECLRYNPASAVGGATLGGIGTAGVRTEGINRTVFLPWDLGSPYLATVHRNTIVSNILTYLSASGPLIDVNALSVQDQDGDGCPVPGEQVWVTCQLRNGGSAASNVQATLSSPSAWCTVTQGAWSPGTLGVGALASNAAAPYRILVSSNAPLGTLIPLTIAVTANAGTYARTSAVNVAVAAPQLLLAGFVTNDSGDHDGAIDPGERVHLIVALTNTGYRAGNVVGTISTSNAYVTLVTSNSVFGTLERSTQARNGCTPFCFDVSPAAPSDSAYSFLLSVSYAGGGTTSAYSLAFGSGGSYTVQPGVGGGWLDMSGGTEVPLSDEVLSSAIDIGFGFPFYGQNFTAAYIDDNGYVQVGNPTYGGTYNNVAIPNSATPNGIIAPFWDDLDTGYGTVRHKLFGSAPNRYWAVEWTDVPRYYSASDIVNIQAILYESGEIRFQYGALSGENSDGRSATIGVESPAGTNGVQYAYDRVGAVTNGQVIVFSAARSDADTDGDGLPDACERFFFGHLGEVAGGDADRDGMSNECELHCGTDPNDPSSVLRLTDAPGVTSIGSGPILRWQSIPGVLYNVRACGDLRAGAWTNLNAVPLIGAPGGMNCFTAAPPVSWPAFWNVAVP
jgi:hypothetical protein